MHFTFNNKLYFATDPNQLQHPPTSLFTDFATFDETSEKWEQLLMATPENQAAASHITDTDVCITTEICQFYYRFPCFLVFLFHSFHLKWYESQWSCKHFLFFFLLVFYIFERLLLQLCLEKCDIMKYNIYNDDTVLTVQCFWLWWNPLWISCYINQSMDRFTFVCKHTDWTIDYSLYSSVNNVWQMVLGQQQPLPACSLTQNIWVSLLTLHSSIKCNKSIHLILFPVSVRI